MTGPTTKQFPGFGLPIVGDDQRRSILRLPLAIGAMPWESKGVTVREKRMLEFISSISDKPDWDTKVFDETIVARWRTESDVRPDELDGDVYLSQEMFDHCIAELRDKATRYKETGCVNVLDSELTVIKSDSAISEQLRNELRDKVRPLEDVPENEKDWHPKSDNLVLDLVHPSLFPVIWGVTRALKEGTVPLDGCIDYTGKGDLVGSFESMSNSSSLQTWGSFQWLPAQVELATDGSAKITSYINNLHPVHHKALYGTLERIVAATVPLWQDALNGFANRLRFKIRNTGDDDYSYPPGLYYRVPGRRGPRAWWDPTVDEYCDKHGNSEDDDDDYDWQNDNAWTDWQDEHRTLVYPEPRRYISEAEIAAKRAEAEALRAKEQTEGKNQPSGVRSLIQDYPQIDLQKYPPIDLQKDFPDGLQVIFKLANIHLTPEQPRYPGGAWHVEGTQNETICASAIYYFDQDNITDSHLAFRQAIDQDELIMMPAQNEYTSLETFFGVEQHGPCTQTLGQVLTREGRLLVFPNCLQHQVQPFELQDKTRAGHRKILAMFLVHPHRPVLSSAHVPPQRRDWWEAEVRRSGALSNLPNELIDMTMKRVDFPLSWEQAVETREKLMEERGMLNERVENYMHRQTFSFCEH
ncbi:uncharacterized protein C8A04DRAFT_13998 [Dichotomopilus funicola]|uniref:Uncharacterized protein n=1 Tax=Dichotomopilus funicola TaxID=1934379 RepID=A0AAN6ZL12_9PEZI|nr:hypothetical protein C8A04DRAFT_13998 [Dichotomopilus funicola]